VNQPPNRRQFLGGLAAAALAASGLTACGPAGTARPAAPRKRYGGNLQAGLTGGSAADTIDPHKPVTDLDISRVQTLYEPLVALDVQARGVQYLLAEQITPRNRSLTEWVIKLRPGITFHDGKPLTADDVLFSFRRISSLKAPGTIFLGPVDLDATAKLDTRTVAVKLTSPIADYAGQLAAAPFDLLIAPAGLNPARPNGTGPFQYHSFSPGQRSVFTRHPHYWQTGLPYADTLTIIDFPNTISLTDALRTGQIHAAGTLDPPQVPTLDTAGGIKVVVSQAGSIVPFTMRTDQAPFNDVRVRQAMRLLVDRPQMIDSALDSYGTLASDVFSPYDPDSGHSLVRHQDIPQARSLLKQAGQEDLKVTLVTSPVLSGVVAMATVLAEQAKAAGVTITLKNVPPGTFFGPNYLNWTFSQDYYSYFPYLAQVAQSMLPASPYNETHNDNPPLHLPVPPGPGHRGHRAAPGDPPRHAADRFHRGRVHHPRVHRHPRRLQRHDHRLRPGPARPAADELRLQALRVHPMTPAVGVTIGLAPGRLRHLPLSALVGRRRPPRRQGSLLRRSRPDLGQTSSRLSHRGCRNVRFGSATMPPQPAPAERSASTFPVGWPRSRQGKSLGRTDRARAPGYGREFTRAISFRPGWRRSAGRTGRR
jgi:peptide/nickel transport system substrate-binding protein